MSDQKITEFEILNHGLYHCAEFQGCGVAFTDYTDVATGIGDNAREAYDDALEQLACGGWDVSSLPTRPRGINAKDRVPASVHREMVEAHIYVSVRVRGPKTLAERIAATLADVAPGVYRWDGRTLTCIKAPNLPIWRCIANLGDRNPLDHGGLFVYVDKTGTYPPEMERIEPVSDDDNSALEIRRVVLDRCTFTDGVLSDNPYHPTLPAWYARELVRVAESFGEPLDDYHSALCSEHPLPRAKAMRDVLDYFGWDNVDSYPFTVTRSEARRRYRNELRHIRRAGR